MKPLNATELRVTRRGTIGPCKCKASPCHRCGGVCRQCKCTYKGYSIIDTLNRMHGKRILKGTRTKRAPKPKQMKAASKIINEPCRCSKRSKAAQSWKHLNDDDSSLLPSASTNTSKVDDKNKNKLIVVMRTLWDPDIFTKAITEFSNTLASLSVPNIQLRAKKLFEDTLRSDLFEKADLSEDIIHNLLDLVNLPHEASIDLQNLLLFSMNRSKIQVYSIKHEMHRITLQKANKLVRFLS